MSTPINQSFPMKKSDDEWRQVLSPEQYAVMRKGGTERPFTGELLKNKDTGVYTCGSCNHPLFSSDQKFDSGTGWPSFMDVVDKGNVILKEDVSHGMHRTEVLCAHCGAHLGHVFPDGPGETGQRYCINSASLGFKKGEGKPETK